MQKKFVDLVFINLFILIVLTAGCSAQSEEQALKALRDMTRDGKLPPESVVADVENRFPNRKSGALAKVLRARIRLENRDFAGAAALLNSDVFKKHTKVADYALWLRAKALQGSGNHIEALRVLDEQLREHPNSVRNREAKLLWASSAIAAARAVEAPPFLVELAEKKDADALLLTAKAYEAQNSTAEAIKFYRRTYFYSAGSNAAKEAEAKLVALAQPLTPQNADDQIARAEKLFSNKSYAEAAIAFDSLALSFPTAMTSTLQLRRLISLANTRKMVDAQRAFDAMPTSAKERETAFRELALGYARTKMWPQTRTTIDAMRSNFPNGSLLPRTIIDVGLAAREAKNRTDEGYFLNMAVAAFPNAVEVAQAQFEAAWFQHENKNFALSSKMFIDHLARFAAKDTTNRGKAGYWAARDSERAEKFQEACALYDGVLNRYAANWYGYLAAERMSVLKSQRRCASTYSPDQTIAKAVANLKTVTVAPETSDSHELQLVEKSEDLSTIGLFDWAIDELNEAKKSAQNSPKINMALARHYRLKGDNVNALLALAKSYPDYSQMFPEEMGREEWAIFYPHVGWDHIKTWSTARRLDLYQVAGLIRQESVFNPRASSHANAYGLMQLLMPTARSVARKYGTTAPASIADLYQPALNIELGTAYMRDQLDKFGRIEYMAVAYNAGPGRVAPWRASLPIEIDEFVEAIPFKETKGYVQGVIRNAAQYRRLYDENGNFKPNVGTRPLRAEIDSKPREEFAAENPDVILSESQADADSL